MKKPLLIAFASLMLAGCGDEDTQELLGGVMVEGEDGVFLAPFLAPSVEYSYPADGQINVPPVTDIILRFTVPVEDPSLVEKLLLTDDDGNLVAFESAELVDGGRGVVATLSNDLKSGTQYQLVFDGGIGSGPNTILTPNAEGAEGIQFTTRPDATGPKNLTSTSATFSVAELLPDGQNFEVMDFSTFRFLFTQPVDPDSIEYGRTVRIFDEENNLVPADVIVKHQSLTVDPCTASLPSECGSENDQLDSTKSYRLELRGVKPLNQDGTDGLNYSLDFTPRETGPTSILIQDIVDSENSERSPLNDTLVNGVILNSVLQGTTDLSQQTGTLNAELAYAVNFPGSQPVPLRIPRGSTLLSSSLDVKINGNVPLLDANTGLPQQTGSVIVTFISDANGYLYPNPYTDDPEAQRHVRLFMDVSMNTAAAQPNASLSQDLMRVELVGLAQVANGLLDINAIGIVEPNILGQDVADVTIAFKLQAETNDQIERLFDQEQNQAPNIPPRLVSWVPGFENSIPATRQAMQRPGDPIILNFDQPLRRNNAETVIIEEDGVRLDASAVSTSIDGTVLTVQVDGGLKPGAEYQVITTSQLQNLEGSPVLSEALTFTMASTQQTDTVGAVSPLALTTYPGFPCASTASLSTVFPVEGEGANHGQCLVSPNTPDVVENQTLPLTLMPADRPIAVIFSQVMDLTSIELGRTFIVEKVTSDGTVSPVGGRLEKAPQRIRFFPNQEWSQSEIYRYTMISAQSDTRNNEICLRGEAICSVAGQPLQTDLLVDSADFGGPDLEIYFRGSPRVESVFTPLRNFPVRDANANYLVECDEQCLEPSTSPVDATGDVLPSENAARITVVNNEATLLNDTLALPARNGCDPLGQECPDNKSVFQTLALNTEVVGPAIDPETGQQGVSVLLYPMLLATTPTNVFLAALGEQTTGTQVLRMRYATPSEDNPQGLVPGMIVTGDRGQPIFKTKVTLSLDAPNLELPEGGQILSHNLYNYPLPLHLVGDITFFDDGRMQIEQRNQNVPPINVLVNLNIESVLGPLGSTLDDLVDLATSITGEVTEALDPVTCSAADLPLLGSLASLLCTENETDEVATLLIPLEIQQEDLYLNFISLPIKEAPLEKR
ncbi:Ig-like domain-containing protein [Thalassolituus sp.]|uniref:Ig-like domain-containing protein n=1 Tax=Thalassolituus sp. TaxID=2030822 RepID=UPI003519AE1A